jgi:hypothetical protein
MFVLMMVHGRVQTKASLIIGTILGHVCEEYTSCTHLDDTLKLEMPKNAVKRAPHCASIETNSDLYQQMGHSMMPIDFDGYFEVLSSAAEN